MQRPELLDGYLGDEEVAGAVRLGDDDVICFTPTRTLLYHGDGLLSDESVAVYDHDVSRIDIKNGRRKDTFELEYLEGTESFSVPSSKTKDVVTELLAGVLGTWGVTEPDESVLDVFRFSELTVVITDARLAKHIGAAVWSESYDEFPYDSVTGLEFEQGQVATQIVISTDGRPNRIKAPSDDAAVLRKTLTTALCEHYDVASASELAERIAPDQALSDTPDDIAGFSLDDGITPLVGEEQDGDSADRTDSSLGSTDESTPAVGADPGTGTDTDTGADANTASEATDTTGTGPGESHEPASGVGPAATTSQRSTAGSDAGEEEATGHGHSNDQTDSDTETRVRVKTDEMASVSAQDDNERQPQPRSQTQPPRASNDTVDGSAATTETAALTDADIAEFRAQLTELSEAVDQQTELLERQHKAIKQLIKELQ